MKVVIFPADDAACGHVRLIWPGEVLAAQGHDVTVAPPEDRRIQVVLDRRTHEVQRLTVGYDADVFVFQRITHRWLVKVVEHLRARGTTVVVDVDDDLTSIHPGNAAFTMLHPRTEGATLEGSDQPSMHSWHHLSAACRAASLVTTSTPALLPVYAAHGRGRVLPNVLAAHYFEPARRPDRAVPTIGWPASLHSHPDDPDVIGPAVARLVRGGAASFVGVGGPHQAAELQSVFGLDGWPTMLGNVALRSWPARIGTLDVGLAPLADTRFNRAKSWLKPLELAATGVPWVGSPRVEYRKLHDLGCGVLAERPKDWYRELRRLVADASWRAELADRGRAVAATLRLEDHAWRWLEAWSDALKLDRSASNAVRRHAGVG